MPRVPRELIEHALNVDPKAKPVKQPLRRFDEPKRKAIASELHMLENAGFIREIKSSTWVSNPVIVPDCYGVDGFSPSSWEPQEEGMMNIAASFSLS
jgi:hypothetical protein